MRRSWCFALASVVLCALSNVSAAGPREYCDLLAKEIANRRTGQSDLITGTINNSDSSSPANSTGTSPALENWQKAYKQKFQECIDDYEVSKPITSPKGAVPVSKKSKAAQRRHARPSPMRTPKAPKSAAKAKIDTDTSQPSETEQQQVKSAPVTKSQSREISQRDSRRHAAKRRPSRKSEMTPVQFDIVPVESSRRKCVYSSRSVCRAP
jgi:hypothetical protein